MSSLLRRSLLIFTLCLTGVIGYFSLAQASDIRTELCESSSTPSLFITAPLSDSVTADSHIRIEGSAQRTDQITIFVNGVQSSIVSIGSSGTINAPVALAKGTNSISLHAYYSCTQASTITTFVVTYEPNARPSHGSSIVTVLPSPGSISQPNTIISTHPPSGDSSDNGPGVTDPDNSIDLDTGAALPTMCQDFYIYSFTHTLALVLLAFLLITTERLYKLASRTRRRPSPSLKLKVRCAIGVLALVFIWFLVRMVINCV